MSDLTLIIPAAGSSTRMRGADKLLTEVDGIPLLRRTALRAIATDRPVTVTLRPDDAARAAALGELPLNLLPVADAATGLSASLRAAAARHRGRLLILPADMPDLTTEDLKALIAASDAAPDRILRGCASDGTPGHPVIFPADLIPAFANLSGDEGARSILQAHKSRVALHTLPGTHALTDLDTPEAWEAWRQSASSTRAS